ncbi:MAG: lysozyme inhibitor LprI family protein [Desulfocapsaceae bacterium]|nr:lysozyme inhibitor LprI family protein [Desulfocapsaceae bacterium]
MKSIIGLSLSLVCLLFVSQTARAEMGECDKYTTSYDQTYCYCKLFMESDKELNEAYKELRSQVKDDVKQQLTQTQRDWMKYRDSTCERQGAINVDCNYKVNRERTIYLRDRVRECKTGNCRSDMIGQKSWN